MFRLSHRSGVSDADSPFVFWFWRQSAAAIGGFSAIGGANAGRQLGSRWASTPATSRPEAVSSFGRSIGQQPAFAMDFLNGGSWSSLVNTAPSYMSAWKGSGLHHDLGPSHAAQLVPAGSNPRTSERYGLAQGAAGAYNSYFLQLAQDMVAAGQGSSIIRPGGSSTAAGSPGRPTGRRPPFIGYWQQIVNTMRSVPGQDFTFEWNPTAGDQGVGNLANYYPGQRLRRLHRPRPLRPVAGRTYPGIASQWNTYLTEPYGLNWLASFAASQGKPITLPEWGLDPDPSSNDGGVVAPRQSEVGGGDDPTFINDMAQWITQNHVYEATYWQYRLEPSQRQRPTPTASPPS